MKLKPLYVIVDPNNPPFAKVEQGRYGPVAEGFEADIVREACRRAGYKPTFVRATLADTLQMIAKAGQTEMVAFASTSPTEERRRLGITFGVPYYETLRQLFTVAGRQVDPQNPKSIAVQKDSKHAIAARQYFPGAEVQEYASGAEALAAMRDGRAETTVTLLPAVWDAIQRKEIVALSKKLAVDGDVGASAAYPTNGVPAIREALNCALTAMLREGWITALAERKNLPFFQPGQAGVRAALS